MPPSGFLSQSVLDTNVWVGNFLSRSPKSFNRRIVRLWLIEQRLKLAISNEIEAEYLRIFQEVLRFDNQQIAEWRKRFNNRQTVKRVRLKVKTPISCDPKDDIFLSTPRSFPKQIFSLPTILICSKSAKPKNKN